MQHQLLRLCDVHGKLARDPLPGRTALPGKTAPLGRAGRTTSCVGTAALLCIALALPQTGCDSAPPGTAVARVAGEDVTVSELKTFALSIPDGFHWDKTDSEATAAILDGLVDKKILLMEVEARGLYAEPEVAGRAAAFRRQEILRVYTRIKVNEVVTITDEEIEERFRRTRRDRSLRPGVVVLETMAEAREVIGVLTRGEANFNDIAAARSAEENTRSWGGDMGRLESCLSRCPLCTKKSVTMPFSRFSMKYRWHLKRWQTRSSRSFSARRGLFEAPSLPTRFGKHIADRYTPTPSVS